MITFANNQIKKNKPYVQSIWPVIKLDLDYVATFWNQVRTRGFVFLSIN
jgi:hypothetical protein